MKKLQKLIIYILNLPLYYISKLIPKNRILWIFGAWFGEKYADNSKYLFEYVNDNCKDIRAIWISSNKKTVDLIKKKGFEVYYSYSLLGYYYSMRAYIAFVVTDFRDINRFAFTGKYINLWHGNPLKKIVYDDKITNIDYDNIFYKIKKIIFPFIKTPREFHRIISSSDKEKIILASAFRKKPDEILVTGLPRNDIFYHKKSINRNEVFKVIYMPTHRNEGELNLSELLFDKIEIIKQFLEENNIELYVKLHFYHENEKINFKNNKIKFVNDDEIEQDIYNILPQFDLLITDYSSVFFDFLLTNNPIIFAPFDYEDYLKKDREFYYDYYKITPGPKCKNWNEVLKWIKNFKENSELYYSEREKIKNVFHKYQDGRNSERVYKKIKKLAEK